VKQLGFDTPEAVDHAAIAKEQKTLSWSQQVRKCSMPSSLHGQLPFESQTLRLKGIDWHPFDVTLLGQQNHCFFHWRSSQHHRTHLQLVHYTPPA